MYVLRYSNGCDYLIEEWAWASLRSWRYTITSHGLGNSWCQQAQPSLGNECVRKMRKALDRVLCTIELKWLKECSHKGEPGKTRSHWCRGNLESVHCKKEDPLCQASLTTVGRLEIRIGPCAQRHQVLSDFLLNRSVESWNKSHTRAI